MIFSNKGFLGLILLYITLHKAEGSNTSSAIGGPLTNYDVAREEEQRATKVITRKQLDDELINAENLESIETFLYHTESFDGKVSISDFTRLALQLRVYYAAYSDLFMQRYDSFSELKVSGGPQVNQELCLQQLRHLIGRAEIQSVQQYSSKDINLAELLDTFGRRPSGFYLGAGYWPGSYNGCRRRQIQTPDGQVETRYCVAHMRDKIWPNQSSSLELLTTVKIGVCLPKSCDSQPYRSKFELLSKLMNFIKSDVSLSQAYLTDLYCLPDEESPLRTWWFRPKTMTMLLCLLIWLSFLIYATLTSKSTRDGNIYSSLSITNNLRSIFKIKRRSAKDNFQSRLSESTDQLALTEMTRDKTTQSGNEITARTPVVDLSVMNSIKVMSLIYIVMGHVLMSLSHNVNNGREATYFFLYTLANMAPAYAVNSFFAITGLRTSYLMFKKNQALTVMINPLAWLAFIRHRYIRIMPMYIIIVAYVKYISKFTGSGPFWDYATSELGHRRTCEQESWLWTLLFASNFKSPTSHCIPSAWYLANDFQFVLITPIFLGLLHIQPLLGMLTLVGAILTSFTASAVNVLYTRIEDIRPVARFMTHGFKIYATHMHDSYTQPQYRICSYLSGLLVGYFLYTYEKDRFELETVKKRQEQNGSQNHTRVSHRFRWYSQVKWPPIVDKGLVLISVSTLLIISASPYYSDFLNRLANIDKPSTRLLVALNMPFNHIIYSIATSVLVLLAATGRGFHYLNTCLSARLWEPLARLSLCVLLINVEVTAYLTQIETKSFLLESMSHFSLNLTSVLVSYLVGIILYVLLEAPIQAILRRVT